MDRRRRARRTARSVLTHVLACLAVGLALASAPGPVQAVLLDEAARGGVPRGLRAVAGASFAFGLLLVGAALGLAVVAPHGAALRVVEVVGGAFLLWIAVEGYRAAYGTSGTATARPGLPPALRGALAVLLNPGTWLFLGTAAASLLAAAARDGGRAGAFAGAFALMAGAGSGDAVLVLLGGTGLRRAGPVTRARVRRALAALLAGLGLWVLARSLLRATPCG